MTKVVKDKLRIETAEGLEERKTAKTGSWSWDVAMMFLIRGQWDSLEDKKRQRNYNVKVIPVKRAARMVLQYWLKANPQWNVDACYVIRHIDYIIVTMRIKKLTRWEAPTPRECPFFFFDKTGMNGELIA